ncbi:MAG TPA: hypothetical protein VEA37_06505 [Flavobacterium sp.]|nr:hypothetical protein [Flavobacterium sp.]
MSQNYVTYRKFSDAAQAKGLQQFLISNGIECIFVDTSPQVGSSVMGGDMLKECEVQLKPDQFEAADKLLENYAATLFDNLPEDYYLLSFTDEELQDVVLKHDEWSEFDYMLAIKLLAERGKTIDEAHIKALREERITDLAKPEKVHVSWIVAGYILALLGGCFGVIIGYVLYSAKKTLPNGAVVYTYTPADRANGKIILLLGIVMLVAGITVLTFR